MMRARMSSGFSIVEVLLLILVMGILLVFSIPRFEDYMEDRALARSAQVLQHFIEVAREFAIAEHDQVSICASEDGYRCGGHWNAGMIAFFDTGGSGVPGHPEDIIFKLPQAKLAGLLSYNGFLSSHRVSFNGQGRLNVTNGAFLQQNGRVSYRIVISDVGRVTLSTG